MFINSLRHFKSCFGVAALVQNCIKQRLSQVLRGAPQPRAWMVLARCTCRAGWRKRAILPRPMQDQWKGAVAAWVKDSDRPVFDNGATEADIINVIYTF